MNDSALCRKARLRSPDGKTFWDDRYVRESLEHIRARHAVARGYCSMCPLLNACEDMLCAHERQRQRISGVIAGRYSDVKAEWTDRLDTRQDKCRMCGRAINPISSQAAKLKHAGEGLCTDCYPAHSRAMRKGVCVS